MQHVGDIAVAEASRDGLSVAEISDVEPIALHGIRVTLAQVIEYEGLYSLSSEGPETRTSHVAGAAGQQYPHYGPLLR